MSSPQITNLQPGSEVVVASGSQDMVRMHWAAYPPVAKLPVEVLGMIFETAISEYECESCEPQYEDLAEPQWTELGRTLQTLMSVSQAWRRIALGFPRLWRNIFVRKALYAHYLPFEECVERSRGTPLHCWVEPLAVELPGGLVGPVLGHLQSADGIARIRKLCFTEYEFTTGDVEVLINVELPILEALSFDACDFTHLSFPTFMSIVQRLKRLRYLRVSQTPFPTDTTSPSAFDSAVPPSLPQLKHLHLSQPTLEDASALFPLIAASQPRDLALGIIEGASSEFIDPPYESFGFIQNLTLVALLTAEILFILHRTPSVTALHLISWLATQDDSNELFEALQEVSGSKPRFIPELRLLSFDYPGISPIPIIGLVEKRAHSSPLTTIRLARSSMSKLRGRKRSSLGQLVCIEEWVAPDLTRLGYVSM